MLGLEGSDLTLALAETVGVSSSEDSSDRLSSGQEGLDVGSVVQLPSRASSSDDWACSAPAKVGPFSSPVVSFPTSERRRFL